MSDHKSNHSSNHNNNNNQLSSFLSNNVTNESELLIKAPTGTGKTTSIANFFARLDKKMTIISIPNKNSAVLMCNYLNKQSSRNNQNNKSYFGYAIQGSKFITNDCKVLFATTGWFVKKILFDSSFHFDHFVLDEAHDQSENAYILLRLIIYLKRVKNRQFGIVIASATISVHYFLSDFPNMIVYDTTTSSLSTNQQKVKIEYYYQNEYEQDDGDMNQDIINILHKINSGHGVGGNKIVFLDGESSVLSLTSLLEAHDSFKEFHICPIYGQMEAEDQEEALRGVDDQKKSKIIVATNIIESSVTLDKITHVISSGWCKRMHTFQDGTRSLEKERCSQSNLMQQAGRAGRVTVFFRGRKIKPKAFFLLTKREFDALPLETPREVDLNPLFRPLIEIIHAKYNPFVLFSDLSKHRITKDMEFLQKNEMIEILTNLTGSYELPPPVTFDELENFLYQLPRKQDDETNCSICMNEYVPGEILVNLNCKHEYHTACIKEWLYNHSRTCPLCRKESEMACNYCGDILNSGSKIYKLSCDHVFHAECIDEKTNHTMTICPVEQCHKPLRTLNSIDYENPDQLYRITSLGTYISKLPTSITNAKFLFSVAKNLSDRPQMRAPLCLLVAIIDCNNSPFFYPRKNANEDDEGHRKRIERLKTQQAKLYGKDDIETMMNLFNQYIVEYEKQTHHAWMIENGLFTKCFSNWWSKYARLHKGMMELDIGFDINQPIASYQEFSSSLWLPISQHHPIYKLHSNGRLMVVENNNIIHSRANANIIKDKYRSFHSEMNFRNGDKQTLSFSLNKRGEMTYASLLFLCPRA
jgi:HrpA-like RNA helicase